MKLSHTMLNFMGYVQADTVEAYGQNRPWFPKSDLEAFLSHFGAVAAVKNGLVIPLETEYGSGYTLTEKGQALGEIGAKLRADHIAHRGNIVASAYIRDGQQLLDNWVEA